MEAAFFDLDKTLISKSSSLALSRPMYRAGMVSRSALLRGAYAQLVYLVVGRPRLFQTLLLALVIHLATWFGRAFLAAQVG